MNDKIKIISGTNYQNIKEEVNAFIQGKVIRDINVSEVYDIEKDHGFCIYHILYCDNQGTQDDE